MRKIKNYLISAVTGLALLTSVQAENFMRGTRGPTNWQFDNRFKLAEQENNGTKTTSFSDTISIRYWNGNTKGIFSYIALPYKIIDNNGHKSNGLGDLGIGIGPRGTIKNNFGSFHYASTIGLQLPTGDEGKTPKLGTGRTDLRFSIGVTYLTPSQKTEVDASFDYIRAEKDASDDILFGIAAGQQIHKKIKTGLGILGNIKYSEIKDKGEKFTLRGIMRYTYSPRWHTELWLDKGILDERNETTLVFRYNF